ncbi:hypothetical protein E5673_14215 [Sphingomonas sp. PAMC26645]|nr:hypothetical protein E5673_14215 [Sphingomonas sp. PAMC26645]
MIYRPNKGPPEGECTLVLLYETLIKDRGPQAFLSDSGPEDSVLISCHTTNLSDESLGVFGSIRTSGRRPKIRESLVSNGSSSPRSTRPAAKPRKWLESISKEARSDELRTDHVRSWVVPITDKDLYGPRGPSPDDIDQDFLGDCYLVATLSAVALRHPLLLKNLIRYDRISQRFVVGLYDVKGKKRHVQVTQLELEDNMIRNGGSKMDNTMQRKIVWPAVFETAYAKLYDSKPLDGLDQGYVKISGGGWPKDAMMAVTGSPGTEMKFQLIPRITRQQSINLLGSRVARALVRHRTITLWSVPEFDGRSQIQKKNNAPFPQDGLVDNHVYTVMSMTRSASLNWTIRLRNPWGTNMAVGEGKDIKSAYISVDLDTLVNTGGLQSFRVSAY